MYSSIIWTHHKTPDDIIALVCGVFINLRVHFGGFASFGTGKSQVLVEYR